MPIEVVQNLAQAFQASSKSSEPEARHRTIRVGWKCPSGSQEAINGTESFLGRWNATGTPYEV